MTTRLFLIQNEDAVINKAINIVSHFHQLTYKQSYHKPGLIHFEVIGWNLITREERIDILHELLTVNAQFIIHMFNT